MPFDGQEVTNDTIRALEKARAYMDEHGWCQGDYESDDGRVCLLGALARAIHCPPPEIDGNDFGSLTSVAKRRGGSIIGVNDRLLASKAEALAVFTEAIELERARLVQGGAG